MQPVPLSKYRQWLDGEAVVYVNACETEVGRVN